MRSARVTLKRYAAYAGMNDRFHALILNACGKRALQRAVALNDKLPFAPASSMLSMQGTVALDRDWMLYAHRGSSKRISEQDRKLLKRPHANELTIAHLKIDHRMERCHLMGEIGDRLQPVPCVAGYNIRWLLRMIVKKGAAFLRAVLVCLQHAGRFPILDYVVASMTSPNDQCIKC